MMKSMLAALALFSTLSLIACNSSSEPQAAAPTELTRRDGYAVLLPEPYEEKVTYVPPMKGKALEHATKRGTLTVSCEQFTDDPDGLKAKAKASTNPIGTLESICGTMVESMGGTVAFKREVYLHKKHPGRELSGKLSKSGKQFRMRVFLINGKYYQVIAKGDPGWVDSPAAYNFLNSLEVR